MTKKHRGLCARAICIASFVFSLISFSCIPFASADPNPHTRFNPDRLRKSCTVIIQYLDQVISTISRNSDPAAQEHLAKEVIFPEVAPGDPNYRSIGDADGRFADEYKTFKNTVIDARESFNSFAPTVRPARTLAFTLGVANSLSVECEVLHYTLMAESPYIDSSGGDNDDFNGNRKSDALEYKEKLIERNKKAVDALLDYCRKIRFRISLLNPDLMQIDNAVLDNFDKVSQLAYTLTTKVRAFELKLAIKRYERNRKYYKAFVDYYKASYDAVSGSISSNRGFGAGRESFFYMTSEESGFVRDDWNVYHVTNVVKKYYVWEIWQWENRPYPGGVGPIYTAPWQDVRPPLQSFPPDLDPDLIPVYYKGDYNIDAIVQSLINYLYYIFWPDAPPPALVEELVESARIHFGDMNSAFRGLLAVRDQLVGDLNRVNGSYKTYFPRSVNVSADPKQARPPLPWPPLFGTDVFWPDTEDYYYTFNYFLNLCQNQVDNPQVDAGSYNPVEIHTGAKFHLAPTVAGFPSDGGPLSYRWVLIDIPHTPNARSQRYVKYQVLSTADTAELEPDLDGTWVVQLEVNNNRQVVSDNANPQAKRIILSVKHHDGEIELDSRDDQLINQQYYLEVSNDETAFFRNFDDDDCPVDSPNYSPSPDQNIFSIQRSPAYTPPPDTGGLYDGQDGSTGLINPKIIRGNLLPLRFCSSAWSQDICDRTGFDLRHHKVPILVKTLDPKITHLSLVWHELSAPYPSPGGFWVLHLKFERDNTTQQCQGEYKISQWVDLKHWYNPGCVLLPFPFRDPNWTTGLGAFSGADRNIPDWMEKRAAEAVNTVGEIFPYVRRIGVTSANVWGKSWPPHPDVYLNPFNRQVRLNEPEGIDAYGFQTIGAGYNESTARHEGFHIYRFLDWRPGRGSDGDWDRLLFKGGPGTLYQYLWDSPANFAGPYGPQYTDTNQIAFNFLGDSKRDASFGKIKRNFTSISIPYFWALIMEPGQLPANKLVVELDSRLYHFPMKRFFVKQAFVLGRNDSVTPARIKKWPLARGLTYEHSGDQRMITNPDLRGMFPGLYSLNNKVLFDLKLLDVSLWQQIYSQILRGGFLPDDAVYFEYEVHSALDIEEFDARLVQPAAHVNFHFLFSDD